MIQLPYSDEQLHEEGLPTTWDNTMRIQLNQCPRKLYYFLRGYDYTLKPPYFTFGSAWHEILHTWYSFEGDKGPEARRDPRIHEACGRNALQAGLDFWDKEGVEGVGDNTRENLISSWEKYLEEYPEEQWTLLPDGGETGWQYPLPKASFLKHDYFLGGSLDGRINWPPFGVLVLEHKTAGVWLSDTYLEQFHLSPQVSGYIWYDTQLQGALPYGALVNMTSKRNAKAGKTSKFTRTLVQKTQRELDEFILDFQLDLLRFEILWEAWQWPKTADPINCVGGVGKSPCLFRYLCKTGGDYKKTDPMSFPNIGVREGGKWEPWKREGEQE